MKHAEDIRKYAAHTSRRLFLLVLAALCVAGQAATLNRPKDPVVLNGSSLTPLVGADVGKIVGFRYVGGWQQIPIQIDERDVVDLAKPYNASAKGVAVLQYCDPNTYTGADSNLLFDGDDELVFMAFDAGDKASGPDPSGVVANSGLEIRITDPIDGGVGYVYLFRTTGGLAPGAGQQYVSYNFNVIGKPNYRTSYDLGGANAEDTTVTTAAYALHFSEMWIHDGLQITTGGATGRGLSRPSKDRSQSELRLPQRRHLFLQPRLLYCQPWRADPRVAHVHGFKQRRLQPVQPDFLRPAHGSDSEPSRASDVFRRERA
jgi:hypothetical protein